MEDLQFKNYLSLEDCRKQIKMLSDNISNDISSSLINEKRIESLRSLLDLFEMYNDMIRRSE